MLETFNVSSMFLLCAFPKKLKKTNSLIHISKSGKSNDLRWRLVADMILADGKKKVIIMDAHYKKMHILKSNGEIGEAVRTKRIIRDGKVIGDMPYVGQLPEKGIFYNYDTEKWDTYIRKKR